MKHQNRSWINVNLDARCSVHDVSLRGAVGRVSWYGDISIIEWPEECPLCRDERELAEQYEKTSDG